MHPGAGGGAQVRIDQHASREQCQSNAENSGQQPSKIGAPGAPGLPERRPEAGLTLHEGIHQREPEDRSQIKHSDQKCQSASNDEGDDPRMGSHGYTQRACKVRDSDVSGQGAQALVEGGGRRTATQKKAEDAQFEPAAYVQRLQQQVDRVSKSTRQSSRRRQGRVGWALEPNKRDVAEGAACHFGASRSRIGRDRFSLEAWISGPLPSLR
jgi:hypothetical protein